MKELTTKEIFSISGGSSNEVHVQAKGNDNGMGANVSAQHNFDNGISVGGWVGGNTSFHENNGNINRGGGFISWNY